MSSTKPNQRSNGWCRLISSRLHECRYCLGVISQHPSHFL
nr:MAG TPA: hypothetical protein [Caudoviricetes sp.]